MESRYVDMEEKITYELCINNDDPLWGYKLFKNFLYNSVAKDERNLNMNELHKEIIEDEKLKMFIIDQKMKQLFLNTKPSTIKEELKLPFDDLFLSVHFPINEKVMVTGILIMFSSSEEKERIKERIKEITNKESPLKIVNSIVVSFRCFEDHEEGILIKPFDIQIDLTDGKILWGLNQHKVEKEEQMIANKVRDFILNTLLFLNEPRVVTYILSTNNKRRERKGLIPIPSLLMTRITPELKEYINITYQSNSKFGYAFDVRGHWRVLRNI